MWICAGVGALTCGVTLVVVLAIVFLPKRRAPARPSSAPDLRGRRELREEDVIDWADNLDRQARADDLRARLRGRNMPAHQAAMNAAFAYTPAAFAPPPPSAPN